MEAIFIKDAKIKANLQKRSKNRKKVAKIQKLCES